MAKQGTGGTLTYPKGEVVWIRLHDGNGELRYLVTSKGENMHNADRSMYYCYKLIDGKWEKLGRGKDPAELEEKYARI